MNKAEIETIKYVIQEHCPPTDLVVKAALKSLADYAVTGAQQLVIHAKFETEGGGAVGSTDAPVKRTEHNDDGSFTVVIDHWPVVQQPQEIEVQCPVCNHKFYEWPNDKQPQAEAVPQREAFEVEFAKLGYQWSDSNKDKAFLGWRLAVERTPQQAASTVDKSCYNCEHHNCSPFLPPCEDCLASPTGYSLWRQKDE